MRKVVVIVCLFGFVCGSRHTDSYVKYKIIGGSNIGIFHRPYIVSVHRKDDGFVCGAIIVSSKWILTALHCIPKPKLKAQYFIRAGSNYYDRSGTLHVFRHVKLYNSTIIKDFGSLVPIHDISLVKIFPEFHFSVRTLPARLPKQYEEPPNKLWVSGWGITSSGQLAKSIQTVSVERIPNDLCHNLSIVYSTLMMFDRHICYGGEHRDSCNGDSGGPLAIARTVHGIVSFGEDCGRLPGVYVKISFYSDWIKSIISQNS